MEKVVSIYEAKTQLSKLVKRAQAGETILIGAYGEAQAVLSPLPAKKKIPIGIWEDKKIENAYTLSDLVEPDSDLIADFEQSVALRDKHEPAN